MMAVEWTKEELERVAARITAFSVMTDDEVLKELVSIARETQILKAIGLGGTGVLALRGVIDPEVPKSLGDIAVARGHLVLAEETQEETV